MEREGGDALDRTLRIRNPRDFFGALGLLVLAVLVLWAMWSLPGLRGFQFGAGTAPRLFAALLAVNAVTVMVLSLFAAGPGVRYTLPAALAVCALGLVGLAVSSIAGPLVAVSASTLAALAAVRLLDQLGVRGPVFIALAILGFATFIKPLGLLAATFFLAAVSSVASKEFRPVESLIWAGALSLLCSLLFSIVLNLPLRVLPAW